MTTKRTNVKKCNTFFSRHLQKWLQEKGNSEVFSLLQGALLFAQTITLMCLTGTTEMVAKQLHPLIQNCEKQLVWSEGENRRIMEAISRSSRVEIRLGLNVDYTIRVEVSFFEKGKTLIGEIVSHSFPVTGEMVMGGGRWT